MANNDLENEIQNADQERLEAYLKILDRVLLYNIVANLMPKESIDGIIKHWEVMLKKSVDSDSDKRTSFLEGTPLGRAAKYQDGWDGEDYRLHCVRQIDLAKKIAVNNLQKTSPSDDQPTAD